MEITGIKYLSPTFDHTGYGEASRNNIIALYSNDIPLTLERVNFENTGPENYGKMGEILSSILNKQIDYNLKIIHLTAEHYPRHREEGKVNLGFAYWETSRIQGRWVNWIHSCVDAQIVCCEYTRNSLLASGVKKPIIKMLPCFDLSIYEIEKSAQKMISCGSDTLKFYSIFQWTERKNPAGLLKAYFTEFTSNDDVVLVLKTYGSNTTQAEQDKIKRQIIDLQHALGIVNPPKLVFIGNLLTRDQIFDIHRSCDCFVLPMRSEGLGIPHAEAAFFGKPVITTALGGHLEFMNDETAYLLPYKMIPVEGMPWIEWYDSSQQWGDPDIDILKQQMRRVYENREEAKIKGELGKKLILEKLDPKTIVENFMKELQDLSR